MIGKASLGEQLVSALVEGGGPSEFARVGRVEHLLKPHELEAFDKVRRHVQKHGVVPAQATIKEMGLRLVPAPEPQSYYVEKLVERHVKIALTKAVHHANEHLRDDPRAMLEHFQNVVFGLGADVNPTQIVDFRDAHDIVVPAYLARMKKSEEGINLGWGYWDTTTGGLRGGDFVGIAGRPAQGKTQFLWSGATHVNEVQNLPAMFVSMEMKPELLLERGAAAYTRTPLAELKQQHQRAIPPARWKKVKDKLLELKTRESPLWVVDGNLAVTVQEICLLTQQLKPAAVFIDGAYLLQHPNPHLQRNTKVAENCDALKSKLATGLNVPVTCTWQFNRDAVKAKGVPGLENVAGSDAIVTHSSIVAALMEAESIETEQRRLLEIIKGRSGEQGSFYIKWDWENMDFGEWVDRSVAEYGV